MMTKIESLTVEVSEPMATEIRTAVDAGDYASPNDVVNDAIRLWSDGRHAQAVDMMMLKQAWDAGQASGLHGVIDFGTLRREARQRLREAKAAAGFDR